MPLTKFIFLFFSTLILLPTSLIANEVDNLCKHNQSICSSQNKKLDSSEIYLKFERIIDGDTFVADGRIIRLWGIDAPEKNEKGYRVSTWLLESILKDKDLACKFISIDRYKRDVMQCRVEDQDVGSIMTKFGMARDYKRFSAGYYEEEEAEARQHKRGIWSTE